FPIRRHQKLEGEKEREEEKKGEEESTLPPPAARKRSRSRPCATPSSLPGATATPGPRKEEPFVTPPTPPVPRRPRPAAATRTTPSTRQSATAATDAGDREDNGTELLEGEDTAAVDEAEPRAQPAQLQPDTATSSPCTTRPHHRTHGSPMDPDYFDDVDYAEEEDKDNTPVCELQVRTWSSSPNVLDGLCCFAQGCLW
ncbi:unnamed protein product, partial [Urochloa humidicola]